MLMVLRVVYAHRLLNDPGYTVEDVATKLGYHQTRSFAQNVKEVFGVTPSELRVALSPDAAVATVRKRYFQNGLANVS
jgi:transcriptional regulator GlxA family with amidase domain